MRSAEPMPGNPWPHDMMITVEDRPTLLLELLWVREAHRLNPVGADVPPLLRETPAPAVNMVNPAVRVAWEEAWPRVWSEVAAHAGSESDPQLFDQLRDTADGSSERASILRSMVGPSWRDEFGEDVFNDRSYREWQQRGRDASLAPPHDTLENSPEWRNLDALVPAWRAGLTKIVAIPCVGEYTRRISVNALLVTDGTRADSEKYQRALTSFATLV